MRSFQEDEERGYSTPYCPGQGVTLLPQVLQVSGSLYKAIMTARSGLAHEKKVVQAKIQDANRTFKLADKKYP